MAAKMEISLISASALLAAFLNNEDEQFLSVVAKRTELLGISREDVESISENLREKIEFLSSSTTFSKADYSLPEEFSLFFSWLMIDMGATGDSSRFNLQVQEECVKLSQSLGVDPSDHKLHIVGWVVGIAPAKLKSQYPTTFPQGLLDINEDARLAFQGLIDHAFFIASDDGEQRSVLEAEMVLTSIPIRVLGLAEAIVRPNADYQDEHALSVLETAIDKVQRILPHALKAKWTDRQSRRELVWNRNSVAHVWNNNSGRPSLTDLVRNLDSSYIESLLAISTYILAGVIADGLRETADVRVTQWLETIDRSIENITVW